jgi:cysteine synthase A
VTGDDLALVDARARELTVERSGFRADQFANPSAARAHETQTARELWDQTGGDIDGFAEFVGTGGTYAGITKALKAHRSTIKCFLVEPSGAAVLAGREATDSHHRIQGGGYSMARLDLLDQIPIDGFMTVTDDEAIEMTRRLAREEGIFGGFSSGAVVSAAVNLLQTEHGGGTVAVVLADSGLKYLSTDLWPAD